MSTKSSTPPRRRSFSTAIALAIILGAWALRIYHLGSQSLWVDEGFSWEVANHALGTIFSTLAAVDRHPPLHYVLLWLTIHLAGSTEFALRFLSAGTSILGMPLVFSLGRRLGGDRVGLVAAALAALSPFQIWYAQEARMYALFATLALASFVFWLRLLDRRDRLSVVGYVVITAAALLTHYFAIFLLPAQLATVLLRREWRADWRRWLPAVLATVILFAPWILVIVRQASRAPRGVQPDLALPDILAQVIATYIAGENAILPLSVLVVATVIAILGLLPTPRVGADPDRSNRNRFDGFILAFWILAAPVGAYTFTALIGIDVRASGRMYYLAGLPAYALLVARGLARIDRALASAWPRIVQASMPLFSIAALALVATFVDASALRHQFYDIHKEDFRTAADIITREQWPGDAVILDAEYIWRPFSYYYRGAAPWFPASVEADRVDAALTLQTAGYDRIWLLLDHEDIADPQHRVQSWLDLNATAIDERWLNGLHLRLYEMERRPRFDRPVSDTSVAARFSDRAEVVGITAPTEAVGGTSLHVTLIWHALARFDVNDHAVLMLTDPAGQIRWQLDRIPISPWYLPKSWQPGEYLTDRYDVEVPLGLPPGTYALKLKLYDPTTGQALPVGGGDDATLGAVHVGPSVAATTLPGTDMLPGLRLLDVTAGPARASPGDDITATILWQSTGPFAPSHAVLLRLIDATGKVAVDREIIPIGGSYSVDRWQLKEVVEDREVLRLPASLPPGSYQVQVSGASNQAAGSIEVQPIARRFDAPHPAHQQSATLAPPNAENRPIADLVGYNIGAAPLRPGSTAHLTLFWKARGETTTEYTVFTHLLGPDGKVHGQQDRQPVGGARRTPSWLTAEIIQDDYDLTVANGSPPGQYSIEVGMYRADTGERLTVDGTRDAIILDTRIQVASTD